MITYYIVWKPKFRFRVLDGLVKDSKVFFLTILGTATFLSCQQKEQGDKNDLPNIVIIFADDMGYGDVSALNPDAKVSTPAIDQLAANGIRFTEAHASGSVCTPSRYGLLTGRYAFRRQESERSAPWGYLPPYIEPGRETLATILKRKGYTTACIGKWHLGLTWPTTDGYGNVKILDEKTRRTNIEYGKPVLGGPNDYGFDYSFIHPASTDMPPYMFLRNTQIVDPEIVLTTDVYNSIYEETILDWDSGKVDTNEGDVYWGRGVWWRRGEISGSFRVEECLPEILNEGLSYIERQVTEHPSNPFFLYLSLTGPHTPWLPSKPIDGKSPIEYYNDFIMDIDNVVGQVTKTLKELGADDNTIVIFTSDNGAPWPGEDIERYNHNSNQGRRGQKGDVWDGGHHIPLIISWPSKIHPGSKYDHLVSLTDVFATFAEMTGQDMSGESGEDSFSFFHVLDGNSVKITRPDSMMIHHSSRGLYGIRKNGWKYIEGLGSGGFTEPGRVNPVPGGPTGQLYNINADPLESENLYQENEQIVNELKQKMDSIINQGHSRL
jgi:arylsulfatase A